MRQILTTFALLSAAAASTAANAAIVCKAETQYGPLTVELDGDVARVNVDSKWADQYDVNETFKVTDVWDGHMTGLVTGAGLAVKYENHYGCIRNVRITTNLRGGGVGYIDEVTVDGCTGGTTPDDLCFQDRP